MTPPPRKKKKVIKPHTPKMNRDEQRSLQYGIFIFTFSVGGGGLASFTQTFKEY